MYRFMSAIAIVLMSAVTAAANDRPQLTVYTYDSFVSDWGPGPAVKAEFEKLCDCELNFVAAGDGAALLARLRLEGERSDADLVLGLDTNLIAEAKASNLFAPHGVSDLNLDLPVAWTDEIFLPFDWGYFAFVHNAELSKVPSNFEELAASDLSIIIQDPRSSTPGLGLLLWVKAAYGERAGEIWAALADNVVTVTPGWSEAYGLFLDGEADLVLSYTTSPAYHLIAEEDASKAAALFSEGHYMQIEVAAKLTSTDNSELADQFLEFMMTEGFQGVIPTTNWMYPVAVPPSGLPDGFETLIRPETSLLLPPGEARDLKLLALVEWRAALSR